MDKFKEQVKSVLNIYSAGKDIDLFMDYIDEHIKYHAEGFDVSLCKQNAWLYDRKYGTFIPGFGYHHSTIILLHFMHNPCGLMNYKFPNEPHMYLTDCMAFHSVKMEEEWLKIPGNITNPSLGSERAIVWDEDKISFDEAESLTEIGIPVTTHYKFAKGM